MYHCAKRSINIPSVTSIPKSVPIKVPCAVADPGFPVGEAPTSDAYTFRQKHMRKRKKWILLSGARAGGTPLDPPMM